MARLILPAVGNLIYPGWGGLIGSLIATIFFPEKLPGQFGPRLGDLKVQESTYGGMIPIPFGQIRMAGQVMWSTPKQETAHEEEQGGKGGQSQTTTTFTYSISFAVALCDREILAIRSIFANGNLIYNLDSSDTNTIVASTNIAAGIRFYPGSETQEADPLIQADVGAANCPAFRGTAYVVFENFQLEAYGNNIPNLEFVVITAGSTVGLRVLEENDNIATPFSTLHALTVFGTPYLLDVNAGVVRIGKNDLTTVYLYDLHGNYLGTDTRTANELPWLENQTIGVWNGVSIHWNDQTKLISSGDVLSKTHMISESGYPFYLPIDEYLVGSTISADGRTLFLMTSLVSGTSAATKWYQIQDPDVIYAQGTVSPSLSISGILGRSRQDNFIGMAMENDLTHIWTSYCAGSHEVKVYAIDDAGNFALSEVLANIWTNLDFPKMAFYADDGVAVGVSASQFVTFTRIPAPSSTAETVADIVTYLSERAGLDPSDLDVSDLTDEVDGYVVARLGNARAAIDPLRKAYFFDGYEGDGLIKFVNRGQASIVTIPEADLAAHNFGSETPDQIALTRGQEMELPVEVDVRYLDNAADYQPGAQRSRRLITQSQVVASEELAIAMTPTKAKEIADVLMYDAWTNRNRFSFPLGNKYAYLEPTDVITTSKGNDTFTLRLLRVDESNGVIKAEAVGEDITVYEQSGTAAEALPPIVTINIPGPTKLQMLDIPLLRDQDDAVGYYVAAAGYLEGWRGAQLYKSIDGGASYAAFGPPIINSATIGSATTVLGNFTGGNKFDEGNTVTVVLVNDATLSSATELAVLNGANAAVLGNEIIQFKTATLTATRTYQLSGLLRGRKGTEQYMSTHATADRFVALSTNSIYIFPGSSAEYGLVRYYKAVSIGMSLDETSAISFTHNGVSQECLSPVQLGGGRNASGDIIINWIRRTRLGAEWNNYSDVPLGETSQAYEVLIYDTNGYGNVLRTITGITTTTTTYTAAQQSANFGSPRAVGNCFFEVYQMSATNGRGFAARGSI